MSVVQNQRADSEQFSTPGTAEPSSLNTREGAASDFEGWDTQAARTLESLGIIDNDIQAPEEINMVNIAQEKLEKRKRAAERRAKIRDPEQIAEREDALQRLGYDSDEAVAVIDSQFAEAQLEEAKEYAEDVKEYMKKNSSVLGVNQSMNRLGFRSQWDPNHPEASDRLEIVNSRAWQLQKGKELPRATGMPPSWATIKPRAYTAKKHALLQQGKDPLEVSAEMGVEDAEARVEMARELAELGRPTGQEQNSRSSNPLLQEWQDEMLGSATVEGRAFGGPVAADGYDMPHDIISTNRTTLLSGPQTFPTQEPTIPIPGFDHSAPEHPAWQYLRRGMPRGHRTDMEAMMPVILANPYFDVPRTRGGPRPSYQESGPWNNPVSTRPSIEENKQSS